MYQQMLEERQQKRRKQEYLITSILIMIVRIIVIYWVGSYCYNHGIITFRLGWMDTFMLYTGFQALCTNTPTLKDMERTDD